MSTCLVSGIAKNIKDEVVPGAVIAFYGHAPMGIGSVVVDSSKQTVTAAADGSFSIALMRGALVRLRSPKLGLSDLVINIPDAGSASFGTLVEAAIQRGATPATPAQPAGGGVKEYETQVELLAAVDDDGTIAYPLDTKIHHKRIGSAWRRLDALGFPESGSFTAGGSVALNAALATAKAVDDLNKKLGDIEGELGSGAAFAALVERVDDLESAGPYALDSDLDALASTTAAVDLAIDARLDALESAGPYALASALASESSTRSAADTALDARLDTLEAAGPYALASDLTSETSARTTADNALDERLDALEAAGPYALSSALATEITDRANADSALDTRLDALEAISIATDSELATAISAEATSRTNADATKVQIGGQLGGTITSPTVIGVRTTSGGGTNLAIDAIADGDYLRRVGGQIVGGTPAGGGGGGDPTFAQVKNALALADSPVDFGDEELTGVGTPDGSDGSSAANVTYVDTELDAVAAAIDSRLDALEGAGPYALASALATEVSDRTSADTGLDARLDAVEANNWVATARIADDAVTYGKVQDVSATNKVLGRSSSGAGIIEEIDCTAAGRALLDDADAAAQRTTLGLGTLATQNGTFSGSSSGTNTGDQTITLTGDVSGSGTGSFGATIADNAVTYAKMQDVSASDRLLGRSTAGAGDVEEITCTAAGRALLDDADATAQRNTLGLGTAATQPSSAFEVPLTFNGGLSRSTNTVSIANDGVTTARILDANVTNAKLANMANATVKGRNTSGSGVPEDVTMAQLRALITAVSGNANEYLNGAGGFSTPAGGGGSSVLEVQRFFAETLDSGDTGWPNTTAAEVKTNVGVSPTVPKREFLGGSLTAAGSHLLVPQNAQHVRIDMLWCAASAPGTTNNKVRFKINTRSLDTTGAGADLTFADFTNANDALMHLQTVEYDLGAGGGEWNISPGDFLQFQLARVVSGVTNNMTQSACLAAIIFTWS